MAVISLEEYGKALNRLKDIFNQWNLLPETSDPSHLSTKEIYSDALIQRFEFTCEIAWKIAAKTMGLSSVAPKMVVREMAQAGLISDLKQWFLFLEARNKSSHSYDYVIAKEVLAVIPIFILEAEKLFILLSGHHG